MLAFGAQFRLEVLGTVGAEDASAWTLPRRYDIEFLGCEWCGVQPLIVPTFRDRMFSTFEGERTWNDDLRSLGTSAIGAVSCELDRCCAMPAICDLSTCA